jgi:hypothetical protein
MRFALSRANITVRSRTIMTGEDPTQVDDLFVSPSEEYSKSMKCYFKCIHMFKPVTVVP